MRVFDALYVEDVIMGLLLASLASEKVLGQTIDLGSGEGVSVRELVGKIQELIPSCVVPQFGALPDRQEEKPEIADTERTRSLLGWRPHWTLTDGLKQTIPWYRENVLRNIPQQ
jgi:nucleoside-diphosphate-sugar epimerase